MLTRDGKPVAALVPIEDLEALEDEYWSRAPADTIAEWEAAGWPPGIPIVDVAHDVGIDVTADPGAAP